MQNAISDTYHNKVVWLWGKGYQTEWEQGYWYKGDSIITQWLSRAQARTYLEITIDYWDPDEEKMVERPYRNQNPFDGRNRVQPAKTFTPPKELVGLCKPGMDPHTKFMLAAWKMVPDMYVQVDGKWLQLFAAPTVTATQTGLTFDPIISSTCPATRSTYARG